MSTSSDPTPDPSSEGPDRPSPVDQATDLAGTAALSDDRLEGLRQELEQLDQVSVADRVEVFDRANATLARELAQLDEV